MICSKFFVSQQQPCNMRTETESLNPCIQPVSGQYKKSFLILSNTFTYIKTAPFASSFVVFIIVHVLRVGTDVGQFALIILNVCTSFNIRYKGNTKYLKIFHGKLHFLCNVVRVCKDNFSCCIDKKETSTDD